MGVMICAYVWFRRVREYGIDRAMEVDPINDLIAVVVVLWITTLLGNLLGFGWNMFLNNWGLGTTFVGSIRVGSLSNDPLQPFSLLYEYITQAPFFGGAGLIVPIRYGLGFYIYMLGSYVNLYGYLQFFLSLGVGFGFGYVLEGLKQRYFPTNGA
jgi:hypothetical protein